MLKDRFGREEEISRVHYEGLTKLQPVFSVRDIAKVGKLYDEVESYHRAMPALEKKQEQYSDVFVPMIDSKLPENLRVSVLSKKGDIWNMNKMLAVLATDEYKKESQNYSRTAGEREKTEVSILLVGGERRQFANCYEENHSEECGKGIDSKEKKDILRRYGRCYVCLKRDHRERNSKNTMNCNGDMAC